MREARDMIELPTQESWDKLYSSNGSFAIRKMFYELSTPAVRKKFPPIFTLRPRPHAGLPSAYQTYMDSIDEFDAALKIVPNMRVWDQLKQANWFKNGDPSHCFEGLKIWQEHMKMRDASLAKRILIEKTEKGEVGAAKALLAETKTKAPVGRKAKASPAEEASKTRMKNFRLQSVGGKTA